MEEESRTGLGLAGLLLSRLRETTVEDVYIDEDEDGLYLGLAFSDGETEYHLTFDQNGVVELSEGPIEGDTLADVIVFDLGEVQPPFSEDGSAAG